MVLVEEVPESSNNINDRESDYETESDISDTDSISTVSSAGDVSEETLIERFYALKDIISPTTRLSIAKKWNWSTSALKTTGKWTGNAVWVLTTSALLVGLPLALAIEDEARIVAQEKEMQMQQSGQQSVSHRDLSN